MRLRWLYTKSQVVANQNQSQHERLLGIEMIGSNELLWSDHVEHNANHVLNIHSKVSTTQTNGGFQHYLRAGKSASQTYIVRYYYNYYASEYTDEPVLRRLKASELQKYLQKPNQKEMFYQPILEKEARQFVDSEAQVSTASKKPVRRLTMLGEQ